MQPDQQDDPILIEALKSANDAIHHAYWELTDASGLIGLTADQRATVEDYVGLLRVGIGHLEDAVRCGDDGAQ